MIESCMAGMKRVWIHLFRQIFSDDISMEFGIDKCATLVLKRGKTTKFDGISLPNGRVMKEFTERAGYKYLGILQADQI